MFFFGKRKINGEIWRGVFLGSVENILQILIYIRFALDVYIYISMVEF